ncbi:MAG TPA: sugar phosphate isomerase/epimerase [Bryobacteraceae bacterium]|nr:sugar phosphate isomerase/epimerase [Bryobacteraceae bacterium]
MCHIERLSRRTFLAVAAATSLAARAGKSIPVGLELFSVRGELKKDLPATLNEISKMGYECVEFFSPYYEWTPDYAKQVRKQLNDINMKCYSTHNGMASFSSDGIGKAIELNKILGSHYMVLASAGKVSTIDGWKQVAETLNKGNEKLSEAGMHSGYHNHALEWKPIDGEKPMDVLAKNTDKSVMLQFDVGTCVEMGNDPVAWITNNPGRIRSLHLKDWAPAKGYRVLFGEGVSPWKKIFAAAEADGKVEFYLVEQEGSQYPELETASRCLVSFHDLHG